MPPRESSVSEADLTLIHALQLAPRAGWAQLAAALGPSADTLARRWARLTAQGRAWSGMLPGALTAGSPAVSTAWIRVECAAGTVPDTAAALVEDPGTLTVQHVTGAADLVVYVALPDAAALDHYVVERLHKLPGVRATRTHVITALYGPAAPPRLNQLTPQQLREVRALNTRGSRAVRPAPLMAAPDAVDQRLLLALAEDGRASVAALAKRIGAGESTARRRLSRLESTAAVLFRTEVAPRHSGRPVWCLICADVPPDQLTPVAAAVSRLRDTRTVATVTGPHNLFVCAWLGRIEELPEYTLGLARKAPGLRIADTMVALRVHKLGAHVLGPDGNRERLVPPDIWGVSSHT
ncbi:Lrp/AsnC family transcriptional regulator [Streptomyces sp. VRA16 Mangrove soil]|uniref:Lrp/AsnC family transcriptional regulator n=1 Tax=Streptomyces sp. VRA16 Mangrove soil TaxID=2817434 RepID=UPI001AA00C21|nr:AsnC family transcriptional regulator [Streptomyces sp. VRA16 Mangrove soil]MBO1333588.1 AsnC family transcriptional regulator [Streptomyces sp. VRA16 Mangrove soil]